MKRLIALAAVLAAVATVLAVLVLAVVPSSAGAVTLRYDDGRYVGQLQAWVDASYVPQAPGRVTLHHAYCRGWRPADGPGVSCTLAGSDEIWLQAEPWQLRMALFHELGHRFDFLVMTDAARAAFARAVNIPVREAWKGSEVFADAFSLCSRRRVLATTYFDEYGPTPTQHRRACRVFRLAAAHFSQFVEE